MTKTSTLLFLLPLIWLLSPSSTTNSTTIVTFSTFCNRLSFSADSDNPGYDLTDNPNLPNDGDFAGFCAGTIISCETENSCRYQDSLILVTLYESTDGINWDNSWDLSQSMDTWLGVTLNEEGCVTEITLAGRGLTGEMPDEVGNLSSLRIGIFSYNNLSGCLPDNYINLCGLQEVRFIFNEHLPYRGNFSQFCDGNDQIGAPCRDGNDNTVDDQIQADCSCRGTDITTCRYQDSLILVDLYTALNGDNWIVNTNWLSNNPISDWHGITLNEEGCVRSIELYNNGLTGTLPIEITTLENLESLLLSSNQLSGSIPSEIGNLTKLNGLFLDFNQLSGSIPMEIGNLSNLADFVLDNNQLTGIIPSELGDIPNLEGIILNNNQLTGNIPASLANSDKLVLIWLNDNQLTGCFPDEFSKFCNLVFTKFENNVGLPWEGDFSRFCNGEEQVDAPCNDGNQYTYKDQIQTDCSCQGVSPTIDCQIIQAVSSETSADGQIELTLKNNGPDFQFWYYGTNINNDQTTFIDLSENDTTIILDNLPLGGYEFYTGPKGDISLGFCALSLGIQSCRERDSLALVELYNSTDGANWINPWDLNSSMENWDGVRLNEGCVDAIDLDGQAGWYEGASGGRNLNGTIPGELDNLKNLKILILARNEGLIGNLPTELGDLSELEQLNLRGCKNITGIIPPSLGQLINLVSLVLYDNDLTGTIPSALGNLVNLERLNLSSNNLTGTIPSSLQQLAKLKNLGLSDNNLSDTIPNILGDLLSLEELRLSSNQLTGSIPTSLGNFSNLTTLLLNSNNLEGEIPKELGNLTKIERFLLDNNELVGEIPTELCNFNNVKIFRLHNNQLTGTIPACLGQLPFDNGLTIFTLSDNNLEGCYDDALLNICQIGFNISGNPQALGYTLVNNPQLPWQGDFSRFCNGEAQIDATCDDGNSATTNEVIQADCSCAETLIDTTTCRYQDSLVLVDLYNSTGGDNWTLNTNWLSDQPINTWYGVTLNEEGCVRSINLNNNQLSGTLPEAITQLTNLEVLYLFDNPDLKGSIPDNIGNLENLIILSVFNCGLSGNIPVSIGELKELMELSLDNNELDGNIPPTIGGLGKLELLFLEQNKLTGPIPIIITQLTNLKRLHLHFNDLSGIIPININELVGLEELFLQGNNLSGGIPESITQLAQLERLYLYDNSSLGGTIPASIDDLKNLVAFGAFNCGLSDSIPTSIGTLTNLIELTLSDNGLEGSIPEALGQLDNLQILWLSNNQLSGCIPENLRNLCYLTEDILVDCVSFAGTDTLRGCQYDFRNNPQLPWEGDFEKFCNGEDQIGAPCNDGNEETQDDKINNNCECIGVICTTLSTAMQNTICFGETFAFANQTLSQAGIYRDTLQTSIGCDSIIALTLSVINIQEESQSIARCIGETYNFNGRLLTQAGNYSDTIQNQTGCDSMIQQLSLSFLSEQQTTENAFTCNPQNAGVDTLFLTSSFGCDSIHIITTTLNESNAITIMQSSCDENQVGVVTNTLVNQFGCDSVVTIETIFDETTDQILLETTSCNPLEVGTDTLIMSNQFGCDSLVITRTALNESNAITIMQSSCDENKVGIVTNTLVNQFGCDSVVTIETIFDETTDQILLETTSCNPLEVGTDTLIMSNQFGCDSLVITRTALNESNAITIMQSSCDENKVGVVTNTLVNQFGCDSVVTIETIFDETIKTTFLDLITCNSAEASIDTLNLKTAEDCDSLVITTTTFMATDSTFILEESCDPNDVGTITEFFINQEGCDSLVLIETIAIELSAILLGTDKITIGTSEESVDIPVTANDLLPTNSDNWIISISSTPLSGVVNITNDKQGIQFDLDADNLLTIDSFHYQICLADCPEFCDTATVVITFDNDCINQLKGNIPTAFSPLSEISLNTNFNPMLEFQDCVTTYDQIEFIIFNQWGEIVYKPELYEEWDGHRQGSIDNLMPRATYYYWLKIPQPAPLKDKVIKGPINLLY